MSEEIKTETSTEPNTIIHTSDAGVITIFREPGFYETLLPETGLLISSVRFQQGTIPENGTNGTTLEGLIATAIHRLTELNGKFQSPYNEAALTGLEQALAQLNARTADRIARGVEGAHVV